jgi:integrase
MASIEDRWFADATDANGDKTKVSLARNGVGLRWRAHYRDPAGKQKNRSFARKTDATNFLTTIEGSKLVGSFIDPALARLTVGEWATRWLEGQEHLKPSTRARYAGIVKTAITPAWSTVRLADVGHADVQRWVGTLSTGSSPATVRKVHRVLSLILDLAVKDGRLVRNPAAGVNLPRATKPERKYLNHAQVAALADECAKPTDVSKHRRFDERENGTYRLIVLFLAYTGVRFGEMAALRVRRLDLLRRRALIAESVTIVDGTQIWGTPKGHERREVPIPNFLIAELATHVKDKDPDDLVFPGTRGGGALRAPIFRRGGFNRAATVIGVDGLHPHELRHTAASLAIAAGADIKVIQQMLGHASAAMTLDQYGHLFGDRLDDVADAMDAARSAAVSPALPGPSVKSRALAGSSL